MAHIGLFGYAALAGMLGMGGLMAFLGVALALKVVETVFRLICMAITGLARGLLSWMRLMARRAARAVKNRLLPALRQKWTGYVADVRAKLARKAKKAVSEKRTEPVIDRLPEEAVPAPGLPVPVSQDPANALEILGLSGVEHLSQKELQLRYGMLLKRFDPTQFPGDQVFLDQLKSAFNSVKSSKGWK